MFYFINFFFSNQSWSYSFYYTYVVNLNYWESNILFIYLFFLFFSRLSSKLIFLIFSFLIFNFFLFFSTTPYKSLLITLMVGTVTIHPLAFYFFTLIFVVKFYYFNMHFFVNRVALSFQTLSLFLTLTLLLGSLWASQSNSWGYFWVNDAVEWLLLLITLYILSVIHFWSHKFLYNFCLIVFMFFNLLLLIRLNFLPTRHNFISSKLTVYLLLFFYCAVTSYCNTSTSFIKKLVRLNLLWVVPAVSLIANPLIFCKYIYFILFIYFLNNKLNPTITSPALHLVFNAFLLIWVFFYNFFFLNYNSSGAFFFNSSIFSFFKSTIVFGEVFFKYYVNFSLLEFVSFFFWWDSVFFSLTTNIFNIMVILNNFTLIYILLLSLVLLKRVESRFLYKKKTFI